MVVALGQRLAYYDVRIEFLPQNGGHWRIIRTQHSDPPVTCSPGMNRDLAGCNYKIWLRHRMNIAIVMLQNPLLIVIVMFLIRQKWTCVIRSPRIGAFSLTGFYPDYEWVKIGERGWKYHQGRQNSGRKIIAVCTIEMLGRWRFRSARLLSQHHCYSSPRYFWEPSAVARFASLWSDAVSQPTDRELNTTTLSRRQNSTSHLTLS